MPSRSRRHRLGRAVDRAALAAAVAVALVAVGCVDPVTDPSTTADSDREAAGPDPEVSGSDREASGSEPESRRSGDDDDPGSDPEGRGAGPHNRLPQELFGAPDECDADVAAATVDTIVAQLDDLARGDYASALSRATSAFQSGTDVTAFRTMIEEGYPLLIQESTAELVRCSRQGSHAVEVGVEVITADGVSAPFVYRLRSDGGRWAIDAAVRLTPPPATA